MGCKEWNQTNQYIALFQLSDRAGYQPGQVNSLILSEQ